jgi:predicted ArsR family transcriptional regulator
MEYRVKHQILNYLKWQGPQTAAALATQLQISPMAVRQHLQALRSRQWVTYQEERRSQGRPVKLWQLTELAAPFFPDSHTALALDLLHSVQVIFGQAGLQQLLMERTERQVSYYAAQIEQLVVECTWQKQVQAIAQLRTQEGYMAEAVSREDGSYVLIENHCPIQAAAQTCQQFCQSELAVFELLLGTGVTIERVEHLLAGDRRCAYRVWSNM